MVNLRAVAAGGLARTVCWALEARLMLTGPAVGEKSRLWLGSGLGKGCCWSMRSLPKLLPANW